MEVTIALLTERVTVLAQRVMDLSGGQKDMGDDFRKYRHEIRLELQRIVQEIDHITYDREIKLKEFGTLSLMVDGLTKRLAAVDGGFSVVRYIWHAVGAILLVIIGWGLRRYVG